MTSIRPTCGLTPIFLDPFAAKSTHHLHPGVPNNGDGKKLPLLHLPGTAIANALWQELEIQHLRDKARTSIKAALTALLRSQLFTVLTKELLVSYLKARDEDAINNIRFMTRPVADDSKDDEIIEFGAHLEQAKGAALTEALGKAAKLFWVLMAATEDGYINPIETAAGAIWDDLPSDIRQTLVKRGSDLSSELDRMLSQLDNEANRILSAPCDIEEQGLLYIRDVGNVSQDFLREWDKAYEAAKSAIAP